jgi:hypothetical protein
VLGQAKIVDSDIDGAPAPVRLCGCDGASCLLPAAAAEDPRLKLRMEMRGNVRLRGDDSGDEGDD